VTRSLRQPRHLSTYIRSKRKKPKTRRQTPNLLYFLDRGTTRFEIKRLIIHPINPHFSWGFVARRRRRARIQGASGRFQPARPRAPQAYSTVRRGTRPSATQQTCPDPPPLQKAREKCGLTGFVDGSIDREGIQMSVLREPK
jgi:hypothetical protein